VIRGSTLIPSTLHRQVAPSPLLAYRRGRAVNQGLNLPKGSDQGGSHSLQSVSAVVLTHRRPRLAGDVVRSLLAVEGIEPARVIVVVNGVGGLDDPSLEEAVTMVRLPKNLGPAGGFARGISAAFSDGSTRWAYLCEDDIGLFALPRPRLADLLDRVRAVDDRPGVGAVVAYGRRFVGRGSHTENFVPPVGVSGDLDDVDVASWGATLLSRQVFDAGVLPEAEWFFGLEDFDFFVRLRRAGFRLLVDAISARAVAEQQSSSGRDRAIETRRPVDTDESWRGYYHARNSIMFARRHGKPSWQLWNLLYSTRHIQLATRWDERRAILHGLWDGILGRTGESPGYGRSLGEYTEAGEGATGESVLP
jgi:GT2 family glycosyltransferase